MLRPIWDPDEVTGVLLAAVAAVEGADVPEDLREHAFGAAVQMLAMRQQTQPAPVFLDPSQLRGGQ